MAAFSQQPPLLLPFPDDVVDCYYDDLFFPNAQSHDELIDIIPYDNTNGGDQFNDVDDPFGFGHFQELMVPSTITTAAAADNDCTNDGSILSVQESSSCVDQSVGGGRPDYDDQLVPAESLAVKSTTTTTTVTSPSQQSGSASGSRRKSRGGSSGSSSSSNSDNSSKDIIVKSETTGKKKPRKKCDDNERANKNKNNNSNIDRKEAPMGYVHVRARRGQATDSHSLAERVRREKISERMKLLQSLVPGCDKVTGKALVLDEIINYVQSLQTQVEFLSVKLATVDPTFYTTHGTIGTDQQQQQQRTGGRVINELNNGSRSSSMMINSRLLPPPTMQQQYCEPARGGFFLQPRRHH